MEALRADPGFATDRDSWRTVTIYRVFLSQRKRLRCPKRPQLADYASRGCRSVLGNGAKHNECFAFKATAISECSEMLHGVGAPRDSLLLYRKASGWLLKQSTLAACLMLTVLLQQASKVLGGEPQ